MPIDVEPGTSQWSAIPTGPQHCAIAYGTSTRVKGRTPATVVATLPYSDHPTILAFLQDINIRVRFQAFCRRPSGNWGAYFRFYNTQRPRRALGYRTPGEVFSEGPAPQDEESTDERWSPEAEVGSYAGAAGPSLNSTLILSN